jgi:hypothetical protein
MVFVCVQRVLQNLLAILDELSPRTFGKTTRIPNRFYKHFGLHNYERIQVYLMKLSNNTSSNPGFSYEMVMNSQSYYPFKDNSTTSVLTGKYTNNEQYYLISMVKAGTQGRFQDISTKETTLQIN